MANTKGSDNPFPSVLFAEHVDPSNPATGFQRLFVDTDHVLKMVDHSGTVTTFGAGFSDPMTTRGDIIVRNASNVTARLAVGSSGKVLSSDGTDVSWQTPSGSFDADVHMTRTYSIDPRFGSFSTTGFTTITGVTGEEYALASSAQNDEIVWKLALSAGTWKVILLFHRFTSRGIATVYFDASSVGTIDMYGTDQPQTVGSITGITVATTAVVAVKLVMATKNGSSSGYGAWLLGVGLHRTA